MNLSDDIVAETQALYNTGNRSNAVETALKDAIRYKKLMKLMSMKGKIAFDEEYLTKQMVLEIHEPNNEFF